ncbi:MAG: hypothetical protein L6Q97_16520 [Thermoanaerobaculia bacterium]|nr:hypothetical protein [Thermoanaerobaculia bacterium]
MSFFIFIALTLLVGFVIVLIGRHTNSHSDRAVQTKNTFDSEVIQPKTISKVEEIPPPLISNSAKPYKRHIAYFVLKVNDLKESVDYISSKLRMYDKLDFEINGRDWLIYDGKKKYIGRLRINNYSRVEKTLSENPKCFAFVESLPFWNDYYNRWEGGLVIGMFVGWPEETDFSIYQSNLEGTGVRNTISASPCFPYRKIELSDSVDILTKQAYLLINSGHLENAYEALIKLWKVKKVWLHDLVVIARKLKRYSEEKEFLLEYIASQSGNLTPEYETRLQVIENRFR